MYVYGTYEGGGNGPKSLFRVTKDWAESKVSWFDPWASEGGDYSGTAIAQSSASSLNTWETFTVTPVIKDIIENNARNNGFLFKFDSKTPRHGVCFRSSEYSQAEQRPKLTVTYEDPNTAIIPNRFVEADISGPCEVTINNLQGRRIASYTLRNADQLKQIKTSLSSGAHIINIRTPDRGSFGKIWIIQ